MAKMTREFSGEYHPGQIKFTCLAEKSMTLSRVNVTCTLDDLHIECDPGQFEIMDNITAEVENIIFLDHMGNPEEGEEDIYGEKYISNSFTFKLDEYLLGKPDLLNEAVLEKFRKFISSPSKLVKVNLPEIYEVNYKEKSLEKDYVTLGKVNIIKEPKPEPYNKERLNKLIKTEKDQQSKTSVLTYFDWSVGFKDESTHFNKDKNKKMNRVNSLDISDENFKKYLKKWKKEHLE